MDPIPSLFATISGHPQRIIVAIITLLVTCRQAKYRILCLFTASGSQRSDALHSIGFPAVLCPGLRIHIRPAIVRSLCPRPKKKTRTACQRGTMYRDRPCFYQSRMRLFRWTKLPAISEHLMSPFMLVYSIIVYGERRRLVVSTT